MTAPAPVRRQTKAGRRRRTAKVVGPGKAKTPRKVSALTKLRYKFDNAMARGPLVVVAWLGGLSLAIMVVTALIALVANLTFAGGSHEGFAENFWQAMLRTVDAGSFAADTAWPTRLLALLITLAGIFLAGSLIGLIANAVDQKVEELRRGKSTVVEAEHTLILGWSDQVPRIVNELVIANESEKYAAIVILSPVDKTEMEDILRDRVPDMKTTRVVCRSGSPASPPDLERSALHHAKSVIVVRGEDGDAGVVKAILAVRAVKDAFDETYVVAELQAADTARIIRSSTEGRVLTVNSDEVVAEVTAQACLQAGLSAVFSDLLDFDGDELYFAPVGELAGRSYADALTAFETSSVIGRFTAEGQVELNPSPDATIAIDDQLVVVAQDDSAIAFSGPTAYPVPSAPTAGRQAAAPMHVVLIGWSSFGHKVLKELDEFLPAGSRVTVVVDGDLASGADVEGVALTNATCQVIVGDGGPDDFTRLDDGEPKRIIVLGYRDALSVDDADARTLVTLLALRSQWPANGTHGVRIVAELLDQQNLVLAVPVGVDDLIVSNALASLLIAQLSEHPALQTIFDDLFDAEGAIIEMRNAAEFVPAQPMPFGSVVAAGAAASVSVFGYRLGATGEVKVNPSKSDVVTLGPDDHVAVVAIA
jgi:Trk K+ transport system NAD-binding subunit